MFCSITASEQLSHTPENPRAPANCALLTFESESIVYDVYYVPAWKDIDSVGDGPFIRSLFFFFFLYVLRESTKHPKPQNRYTLTLDILKKKPFTLQIPPVGQYWESVSAP